MLLSNFDRPSGSAVPTIQDTLHTFDRREDESAVEHNVEHAVLRLKAVSFFLFLHQ